jgi:hypothetical protein
MRVESPETQRKLVKLYNLLKSVGNTFLKVTEGKAKVVPVLN